MLSRLFSHVKLSLLLVYLYFGISLACILLLNGWKPIPITQRAKLADIVVRARVLKTHKETRTSTDNSYSANFKIDTVLKGHRILEEIGYKKDYKDEFIVSNFGDRTMCYADVDEGQDYLLFMTTFDGGLSGQYDDLFGAASEYRQEDEAEIFQSLGWKSWSEWSGCSVTCGGGIQTRRRDCISNNQSDCDGGESEQRKCNSYLCKGAMDLLSLFTNVDLIPGVDASEERPAAFILDGTANVNVPTARFFHGGAGDYFPSEFSVLITAKPSAGNSGYILTISDIMGFVKLGIQVGLDPNFEYGNVSGSSTLSRSNKGQRSIKFQTDLSDGSWHQFAYGVTRSEVTLYVDCLLVDSVNLHQEQDYRISANSVISIGKSFFESRKYPRFEGYVEQLVISPDPTAAEAQCDANSGPITDLPHNTQDILPTARPLHEHTTPSSSPDQPVSISWTAWSPCSVTCGRGSQTRTAYCAGNDVTLERCYGLSQGALQTKTCNAGKCPRAHEKKCRGQECLHGGECTRSGRCSCPQGYYGRHCQYVSCTPGCYNGGYCQTPDVCSCPPGWQGEQCEQAVCEPACSGGGKCVRPGVCSCPYGFLPPDCRPQCPLQCFNGGTCVGYNVCRCPKHYSGNLCETAVCDGGCGGHGTCVAPNVCLCSAGWTGTQCDRAVCRPACQNGGSCIYPYFCQCPQSTYGTFCEKFMCSPPCLHGGTCIGLNTCACRRSYTGKYCEESTCRIKCLNGGRCVHNHCRCPLGYHGVHCERRSCRYTRMAVPVQRSRLQSHEEEYNHPCGLFGWNTCSALKTTYRISYHTVTRIVHRCI